MSFFTPPLKVAITSASFSTGRQLATIPFTEPLTEPQEQLKEVMSSGGAHHQISWLLREAERLASSGAKGREKARADRLEGTYFKVGEDHRIQLITVVRGVWEIPGKVGVIKG